VLGPFIGALVDRWNRKRIMLFADTVVAAASGLLALLFLVGTVSYGIVLALLFVRALGSAFHGPAMMASTSLMVPKEHLTRIQGLNQGLQGGALVVTAPMGAIGFMVPSIVRIEETADVLA
jgi:DHA3 family macrolide efflux protein-like MFS transporter